MTEHALPSHAVLVAGGRGDRLGVIVRDVPKPLLPVQGVPVIERLIDRLRDAGVESCTVVTCHRAAQVEARLGTGRALGVAIEFLREPLPLGTAGCLGSMRRPAGPFYLVNADIVTDLCFRSLAERHRRAAAAATVAVRRHETTIPFGVVDVDAAGCMAAYREKPVLTAIVAMGIACLEPRVCGLVAPWSPASLPDVLERLREKGEPVACHEFAGQWRDIGDPEGYAASQRIPLPAFRGAGGRRAA